MYDSEIEIYGQLTKESAEAAFELAEAAAAEGMLNWMERFDRDGFIRLLEAAAAENRSVTLTQRSTDPFEETTAACRKAGLSYVVKRGPTGQEGYTEGVAWRRGMASELGFHLNEGELMFRLGVLRAVLNAERGDVASLLDRTEDLLDTSWISIKPGFIEAYEEFAGLSPAASAPGA